MKEGDSNTKFFHRRASNRKSKNRITSLSNEDGIVQTEDTEIGDIIFKYYQNLFTSEISYNQDRWNTSFNGFSERITPDMYSSLSSEYTEEEVQRAVFQINPSKAPGKDGFTALFYHKFWNDIKAKLTKEILQFLNGGNLDQVHNVTQIVLIPKLKNPVHISDFRPISLCTVYMKIISRILLNRIQPFLDNIISVNQSAFIKNRQISDNIILAQELNFFIQNRRNQKQGYASLKLDMTKAFDRIEWLFLETMLIKLGIPDAWIRNVMLCIRSVTYEVKFNNNVTDLIVPQRGLRQGDPLSPYLFIICSEWLSWQIGKNQTDKHFEGINICRGAPPISHLFFADDSMIFLKITPRCIETLKKILSEYESLSGQKINFAKSEICISKNTSVSDRLLVSSSLNVKQVLYHGNYLGLPFIYGHQKRAAFQNILDKCQRCADNWCNKSLSVAGKEVLIKSILQSLPTYMMACFKFPVSILKKFQSILLNFWWGADSSTRKTHWIHKDLFLKQQISGGLGFRNMSHFNMALLAKQAWRIMKYPDTLLSRVLKARYFPYTDLLSSSEPSRSSYAWKSIFSAMSILRKNVYFDPLSNMYICHSSHEDFFSVRTTYKLIETDELKLTHQEGPSSSSLSESYWKLLWRSHLPRKIKLFIWRCFHNGIPVGNELKKRLGSDDFSCKFCGFNEESYIHLFKDCWWIQALWDTLGLSMHHLSYQFTNFADWIYYLSCSLSSEEFRMALVTFWFTWFNRNRCWHGENFLEIHLVKTKINLFMKRIQSAHSVYQTRFQSDLLSWKPPISDYIKINTDGAWFSRNSCCGIGIVCRNHSGHLLVVHSIAIYNVNNALDAEGLALQQGMNLAMNLNLDKTIFETDCSALADLLWFPSSTDNSLFPAWYLYCKEQLFNHKEWQINLIRREANMAADAAAKRARNFGLSWERTDGSPSFIASHILKDL